ncbi:MAG: tripartite tricarboxylate transporter substrate-binding protein, partial [Pseudomonadota bacterium]
MRCVSYGWRYFIVALLVALTTTVCAQEYPTRLIRLIVPFPPAGATDNYSRVLAKELQSSFGQNVIVDNRPGATGLIGTELAKRAPPDG